VLAFDEIVKDVSAVEMIILSPMQKDNAAGQSGLDATRRTKNMQ
jgi:hypothetical protein